MLANEIDYGGDSAIHRCKPIPIIRLRHLAGKEGPHRHQRMAGWVSAGSGGAPPRPGWRKPSLAQSTAVLVVLPGNRRQYVQQHSVIASSSVQDCPPATARRQWRGPGKGWAPPGRRARPSALAGQGLIKSPVVRKSLNSMLSNKRNIRSIGRC
jgi:hypothetical protein